MPKRRKTLTVEEFQGLYGPFQASELLVQKIWLKGAFDLHRLVDHWGRQVEVESPGTWNRLEGPDFKNASLRIDGESVYGDVEIHFSQNDWIAHKHHEDGAYSRVVLHVVYFPVNQMSPPTVTSDGEVVPVVSLMELLWRDLEEYASDDSLVASTGSESDASLDDLHALEETDRKDALLDFAAERWKQKAHFAGMRIEMLGWEGACHSTAMEVLGFAANRIPMLQVASAYDMEAFRDNDLTVPQLSEAGFGKWRIQGARPANHPRIRLGQYIEWVKARPHWPAVLADLSDAFPETEKPVTAVSVFRRNHSLPEIRESIVCKVVADRVSGSKFDTLVCDGFLPLLAARSGRDLFGVWFSWFAGTAPESCVESLKRLGVLAPRSRPLCNGWIQGVLGAKVKDSES